MSQVNPDQTQTIHRHKLHLFDKGSQRGMRQLLTFVEEGEGGRGGFLMPKMYGEEPIESKFSRIICWVSVQARKQRHEKLPLGDFVLDKR